ncbi:MAG: hypothetical protein JXA57_06180 [Armatimonadetes bacterium]|nr:hypothetical protein [Armatimonadota bacterium]
MTSADRVRRAFAHGEADRVPIYEQSVCCRVASEFMGREMRTGGGRIRFEETASRWESELAWEEYSSQLIADVADLVRALEFDLVGIPWRHSARPSQRLDEHTFRYDDEEAGLWSIFHYEPTSDVFEQVDSAIRQEGIPAIERLVAAAERSAAGALPPTGDDLAELLRLSELAGGDRAIKAGTGFLQIPTESAWLEAAAAQPSLVERYLDAVTEQALVQIPALPKFGVSVLWAGGDLASNSGPLYSPAMFRRLLLPRLQRITEAVHEAGLVYVFRTDGNVWPIAEDLFVASGIDGYGEIDNDAGMDLAEIATSFPHLTLWGGISCGRTLALGDPASVREETRRVMEVCKPGGGLIFGSSNSIHTGVPTENFLAMQEAAREFGSYS